MEVVVVVFVVEGYRDHGEDFEVFGVVGLEVFDGSVGVYEDGLAASDGVAEAV